MRRTLALFLLLAACEPKDVGGGGGLGGRIAFVRGGDVWVVSDDGQTGEARLTTSGGAAQPALSHLTIAYSASVNGGSEIWRVSVGGGDAARLGPASSGDRAEAPSWTADGSQIAFDVASGGSAQLFLMASDGSGVHAVNAPAATMPVFSRDGSLLLAVFAGGLGTVPVGGAAQPNLLQPAGLGTITSRGIYSPDGAHIAFAAPQNGHQHIFVMNADGSSPKPLPGTGGDDTWPTWSFDGSTIAFQSNAGGTTNVYAISVDKGTDPVTLIGDAETPSWSAQ